MPYADAHRPSPSAVPQFVDAWQPCIDVRAAWPARIGPRVNMFNRYRVADAPAAMCEAAAVFETRFAITFDSLTHFPGDAFARLHARAGDENSLMTRVDVAFECHDSVRADFEVLTQVANMPLPDAADRIGYFDALLRVYECVGIPAYNADSVIVAPEREGRMLAEALGWLRDPSDLVPHAKRIAYRHGLLVGVARCPQPARGAHLVCVDGAIASGGTLIAILDSLAAPGTRVDIYSVHAAREGIRAILRFAELARLDVRLHVGHVTDGLSPKFYAVEGPDHHVVVGDIGDMISTAAYRAACR